MSKVDLHLHSTASDGGLSPKDIVLKSMELRLTTISITDHDSVDGIVPALVAAKAFPWLRVIPGVELSTDVPQGEVHILGYFIDYSNQELQASLAKLRNTRQERAKGIIARLKIFGIHLEWSRIQEIAGSGSIGRPHIAQAMLEKDYIDSIKEAFTKYISRDGPAYVERAKMSPVESVKLILQADGLPVMAHPLTVHNPEIMIAELKKAGLVGIEAYYAGYTADESNRLVSLANEYNLIATGGTDFHGLSASTETMIGGVNVPTESAERLIALAKQYELKSAP
ncbi:PHP domain-containing protein [Chloroflexota bacterium]